MTRDDEIEHETEHALAGGNVAASVVRVGDTVRKPAGFWTPAVEALLAFLGARGFSGAPRPLGRDDRGRQVLEYVPGPMAIDQPPLDVSGLHRVGRLIRDLHDASAEFSPPPGARWNVAIPPDRSDLVCHHDLAPWNLVLGAERWVFIDWDGAGPGSRLWDLAYAVRGFVPLEDGGDPGFDGPRLRAMADGYELSAGQRSRLPALIGAHTRGMAGLLEDGARTGAQPWARLHAEGHFTYWAASADYIDRHRDTWRQFLHHRD
ncbi:MAG TPA: phosphotransferase [Streptosporangiaceae bacterium]|jgi:Ser/Thr protein kinase RdoA (MazF antagonist)